MSGDGLVPRLGWCHPSLPALEARVPQVVAPGRGWEGNLGRAGAPCLALGLRGTCLCQLPGPSGRKLSESGEMESFRNNPCGARVCSAQHHQPLISCAFRRGLQDCHFAGCHRLMALSHQNPEQSAVTGQGAMGPRVTSSKSIFHR